MDMGKMMKQFQKIQAEIAKLQEEIASRTVEASAGGGAVRVVVSGGRELRDIQITSDATDDLELLQDLIIVAVNEGLRKAEEMANSELAKVTGGLGLPPGLL
ncbi:MAG TPA: YbaB/EbfC family nucleoid-associated protein [Clostridiales bacterium UBA8153]|nr:YbaB/EbfC family nucleoid-associated protein [Clostridiales bacterium UBA8153]